MNKYQRWKKGMQELTPAQQLYGKLMGHIGCIVGLSLAMIMMSARGVFYFLLFLFFLIWLQGIEAIGTYQRWKITAQYQQQQEMQQEYRNKKGNALVNKSRTTRAETYKGQRDVLFWLLYNKFKLNYTRIARLCKDYGYSIDRTTIYDVIMQKKREILEEEIKNEAEAEKLVEKTPNNTDIPQN